MRAAWHRGRFAVLPLICLLGCAAEVSGPSDDASVPTDGGLRDSSLRDRTIPEGSDLIIDEDCFVIEEDGGPTDDAGMDEDGAVPEEDLAASEEDLASPDEDGGALDEDLAAPNGKDASVPPMGDGGVPRDLRVTGDGAVAKDLVTRDLISPSDGAVTPPISVQCDVLVAGGGVGGVAAAHEAASSGVSVCLIEPTTWLGGQMTSQGTSALDEGYLEFAASYADLRSRLRAYYLSTYSVVSSSNEAAEPGTFDPGSCWVSRLCFEPQVAATIIERDLLGPLVSQGRLRIYKGYSPTSVTRQGSRVTAVRFTGAGGKLLDAQATITIDATELGDLLPLAGAGYRSGKESKAETGEPSAAASADAECVQPFTYTFALELMPASENHGIARPPGYDASLYDLGKWKVFQPDANGWAFWNYRRLLAAANFRSGVPRDLALINWGNPWGNDFNRGCTSDGCNLIDKPAAQAARILQRGREHALGFVYFLQHDVPRDDGGRGYPNLKLRPDVMGTSDGLSMFPYIREARRLRALTLIRENDVAGSAQERGSIYKDTIGVTHYALDIHGCARGDVTLQNTSAKLAQVPLGALIPESVDGLLAGAKNIGMTHISNGMYREHPIEWTVGQAAAALAVRAIRDGIQPRAVRADPAKLKRLQRDLLVGRGGALYWWNDVPRSDGAWTAVQVLGAAQVMIGSGDLNFHPGDTMPRSQAAQVTVNELGIPPVTGCHASFSDVPCSHWAYGAVQALADRGVTSGTGNGQYSPDAAITRAQLAVFLVRGACNPRWDESKCPLTRPAKASYSDTPTTHSLWPYVETARTQGLFDGEVTGATFAPDQPITRRSAALWLYNHMRRANGF